MKVIRQIYGLARCRALVAGCLFHYPSRGDTHKPARTQLVISETNQAHCVSFCTSLERAPSKAHPPLSEIWAGRDEEGTIGFIHPRCGTHIASRGRHAQNKVQTMEAQPDVALALNLIGSKTMWHQWDRANLIWTEGWRHSNLMASPYPITCILCNQR